MWAHMKKRVHLPPPMVWYDGLQYEELDFRMQWNHLEMNSGEMSCIKE